MCGITIVVSKGDEGCTCRPPACIASAPETWFRYTDNRQMPPAVLSKFFRMLGSFVGRTTINNDQFPSTVRGECPNVTQPRPKRVAAIPGTNYECDFTFSIHQCSCTAHIT